MELGQIGGEDGETGTVDAKPLHVWQPRILMGKASALESSSEPQGHDSSPCSLSRGSMVCPGEGEVDILGWGTAIKKKTRAEAGCPEKCYTIDNQLSSLSP